MRIGAMNHPARELLGEIDWIAGLGFDFVDLTLEPPFGSARQIDVPAVRSALESRHLGLVGHTAYYLPLCHPFASIRRASVDELKRCLETFAALGARWMNVHPDNRAPMHDRGYVIDRNLECLRELLETARNVGVGLMIENLPGSFNTVHEIGELLEPLPDLGLHLDLGHANLMVDHNTAEDLLQAYGSRLRHVHLHDNKGGSADLHLPLGAGSIDIPCYIGALQAAGYNQTITLEVFTPDDHYLSYSREVLSRIWDERAAAARTPVAR